MQRVIGLLLIAACIVAAQPTAEELEAQCLDVCDTAQQACPLHHVRCEDQCDGATNSTIEKTTAMRDAITSTSNATHLAFFCSTMFVASGSHTLPTLTLPAAKSTTVGYTMIVIFCVVGAAILFAAGYCYYQYDKKNTMDGDESVEKQKLTGKRGHSKNRS
jgi:hypothetical protein